MTAPTKPTEGVTGRGDGRTILVCPEDQEPGGCQRPPTLCRFPSCLQPPLTKEPLEIAYGCLWRTITDNTDLHDARAAISRQIGSDGRKRGVRCEVMDVDRYDRLVLRCAVNGRDLGGQLVSEGLVIADERYGREYRDEEAAARRAGRGIWR